MASSNDTYAGALEVLAKQLATMSMLADANLPFVSQLLQMVQDEARSPELAMQRAGVLPPSGGNPQGAGALGLPMGGVGGGSPGGMSAPPPSFLGAGVPGAGPQQSPPPLTDALLRSLSAA
jgi:hypothetical protein